ncbi:MAG TPA: hypothetical protein VFW83_07070 [Bryobacteraceae bacterium]|nr:hypothetical protein [Bryobacteraceae bacterium]
MSFAAQTERGSSSAPLDILHAVAHELRQPLSNIESIAYYLGLLLPHADETVHQQLAHIRELIEQSNWILSSGLNLVTPPRGSSELVDLEEIVRESITAHCFSSPRRYNLELAGLPPLQLDPGLARAIVDSLTILSQQIASGSGPVTIRTRSLPQSRVLLEISTEPSRQPEASLGPGCALAIASVRQMTEAHGGRLDCSINSSAGIRIQAILAET